MLALLLATLFSSAFALILRDAMNRKCNPYAVGLGNYIIATALQLARHYIATPDVAPQPSTLLLGAATGALYAVNFLLFIPLLHQRGVSIANAMLRLAVIFPILASTLLWGERLAWVQGAGVALSLVALPMLTITPGQGGLKSIKPGMAWLLGALLLGNGASMVLAKMYERSADPTQDALFLAVLFGTAIIISGAAWLWRRQGTSMRDILPGALLGLANALGNWGLVTSLGQLPGVLVFPIYSAGGLVCSAVLARLLLRERINQLEAAGIAVAVVALSLANLG